MSWNIGHPRLILWYVESLWNINYALLLFSSYFTYFVYFDLMWLAHVVWHFISIMVWESYHMASIILCYIEIMYFVTDIWKRMLILSVFYRFIQLYRCRQYIGVYMAMSSLDKCFNIASFRIDTHSSRIDHISDTFMTYPLIMIW